MTDFLPQKLSASKLRQTIKTARDLRLFSASVDRAFVGGAFNPIITEQGVRTTNYQVRELSLGVRRINRARAKELERAAPSTEKGTMGTIRENNLRPKRFDIDRIRSSDWDKFVESVERQSMDSYASEKMERYKENYILALMNVFGPKADDLITIIRQLPAPTIYDAFYQNPNLQLGFIYDPLESNLILETITEEWASML